MLKVGVFGATGYAGREAVRLLSVHPRAKVAFTTGSGEGHLAHEAGLDQAADAYLLSLPHGISSSYAARLRKLAGAVVVVSPGDLRLPDAALTGSGTATSTRPPRCWGAVWPDEPTAIAPRRAPHRQPGLLCRRRPPSPVALVREASWTPTTS
jgi:hypothetical protein